jgi:hypothetical protein
MGLSALPRHSEFKLALKIMVRRMTAPPELAKRLSEVA